MRSVLAPMGRALSAARAAPTVRGTAGGRPAASGPIQFLIPSVLLLALLFFFQLGARDLVSSHEARGAQNAPPAERTARFSMREAPEILLVTK